MKTIRMLILILMLAVCFPVNVFATEEIPLTSEELPIQESEYHEPIVKDIQPTFPDEVGETNSYGDTLVYNDGIRKIYYSEEFNTYMDSNGIDSVSKDELLLLGIIKAESQLHESESGYETDSAVEPVAEPSKPAIEKNITLNITTNIENFDVDESYINYIDVIIKGEEVIEEEAYTPEFGKAHLTKADNFSKSETFRCTDGSFFLSAEIPNDFSKAYEVSILHNGEKMTEYSADQDSYDIVINVYKPDGSVTDTNITPSLSNDFKKIADGTYRESRAAEVFPEETEAAEEPASMNPWMVVVMIVVLVLIIGIGILFAFAIRAAREDE